MRIIGHRGAAAVAPENTVPSIARAFADGADAVEVDVRLTADGRLVVVHDDDLERVTGVRNRVSEVTVGELRTLDAGWGFEASGERPWSGRGVRVPLLDEVWEAAAGRVVVELKAEWASDVALEAASAFARWVRSSGVDVSRAVVSSFDVRAIAALRDQSLDVRTGVLTPAAFDAASNIAAAVEGRHEICFLPDAVVDRAVVEAAHDAGREVVVWTVDDAQRLSALAAWGADAVIADDPGAARQAITRSADGSFQNRNRDSGSRISPST